MKNIARLFGLCVLGLSLVGVRGEQARAQTKIGIPIMPVKDIRPGMKGRGVTVFKGTKPQEFRFEVLDILWKRHVGGNAVIIRMSGGPLEKTAIIAGMSGSPCYIDGKLIGAVAFGWHFESEPIAGEIS